MTTAVRVEDLQRVGPPVKCPSCGKRGTRRRYSDGTWGVLHVLHVSGLNWVVCYQGKEAAR